MRSTHQDTGKGTAQTDAAAQAFQPPKKKRKWPKVVMIVAIIAVALLLVLRSLTHNASSSLSGMYLTETVGRQDLSITVTGSGTIRPNDDYRATTLLRGEILSAPFEEGDLVEKDQVLFTLDPTDAENNIRSAESGVERAKLNLEQAQLSYDDLCKTQRNNAADMVIKSNATGTLTRLHIKKGESVAAGMPIGEVTDQNQEVKQITATVSGKVEALSVKEGDWVEDGQKLGSFEPPDLQSQIDSASINIRVAKLALSDAEDALRIAQDLLDDYTITSPISGTVIEKNYKAGDNVDATAGGGYMAVIYDMSRMTFDMNVSELDVSKLKVGQRVTFTSDALAGQTFTGHVDKINVNGTTMNGSTNYPVTVVVESGEGLYPGMNVSATILVENVGEALAVPVEAVQRGDTVIVAPAGSLNKDGELADGTKPEERTVKLGRSNSDFIEILSGIEPGEIVCIPNTASNAMQTMMGMMGG